MVNPQPFGRLVMHLCFLFLPYANGIFLRNSQFLGDSNPRDGDTHTDFHVERYSSRGALSEEKVVRPKTPESKCTTFI